MVGVRHGYVIFAVVVFGLTFAATVGDVIPAVKIEVEWPANREHLYEPNMRAERGRELALIYIGSSTCSYSNVEWLPEAIEELKLEIKQVADTTDRSFSATGIALDWKVNAGLEHLEKFGKFDEILAGRKWLNLGAMRYIWDDIPGKPGTPQVLVVDRFVEVPTDGSGGGYLIRDETLVMRKVGIIEIRRWLEHGAPLPTLKPIAESG